MAPTKLSRKEEELKSALTSLEAVLNIDLSSKTEIEIDAIKNGQIQKFEYSLELLWKTLREKYKDMGIVFNYPKDVFRERFKTTNLSEEEKQDSLIMIDDRNMIAHEYQDYIMGVIWPKLPKYLKLMNELVG